MISQTIDINGYWTVKILYNLPLPEINAGFTHTDFRKRRSIVVIGQAESRAQFFNTMIHELKHVQSHICRYYDVSEKGEQAAYLSGFLAMNVHKELRKFI